MRTNFDIVGSFNTQINSPFDAEKILNWFELSDPKGKRGKALAPTPGLKAQTTIGLNPGVHAGFRGRFVFKGNAYIVVGQYLYVMDKYLACNVIGTLQTFEGQVDITANAFQVFIVDGSKGYIYDTRTNNFTVLSGNGFPLVPIGADFIDGYFVTGVRDTNEWVISKLNDGTVWNDIDGVNPNLAAINAHPGNVVCLKVLHRRLFIFSENFCEVWENAGFSDFPLRRNNVLLLEFGTISKASVVVAFDRMFFLSNNIDGFGHVMMVTGTEVIKISTQALDSTLQGYSTITDASSMVNLIDGIVFYRLNFTQQDVTWVFNVTQSTPEDLRWHNESPLNGGRHVAEVGIWFNEKNYVGAYDKPTLYLMGSQFLTNDGETIVRQRVTQQLYDPETNNLIRLDRIYIDLLEGGNEIPENNDPPDTDSEPKIQVEISRDGAISYGNALFAPIGKTGERVFRTIGDLRALGLARTFTFRITAYNQIKYFLMGMIIDYEIEDQ